MRSYALYSDDHGETWQRGDLLHAFADECQFVELADGALMIDARQNYGDHRWVAISQDGGEQWSRPRAGQFLTPVATSIERFTLKSAGDDRDRIVWTGPKGPGRQTLVVRVSYDEGQTFRNEKVIYGGFTAYSDISILKDKTVGVLWERGVSKGYQFITFTRLDREFLETP
jgi:sialidase-1